MRLLFALIGLLLASPVVAGDLASFQLSTRHYPDGRLPCNAYPPPLVDAWANMTTSAIYIRSVRATITGPAGLRSDTGVNVMLYHDPRYGSPTAVYHESVDWYAEPDGPSALPAYEFAPDYLIVRYGEYLQMEVGCVIQPGNTAAPSWLDVTVTVYYVTEEPSGRDLAYGWLDTSPMILACTPNGTPVQREWMNSIGAPIHLRLLHAWPGISGGARVRAKADVYAVRPTREWAVIRPTWWGEAMTATKDLLLRHVWNRYAEPGNAHSAVVALRNDTVTLLPGEKLVFEVSCRGAGFHQQNLLFFYGVG